MSSKDKESVDKMLASKGITRMSDKDPDFDAKIAEIKANSKPMFTLECVDPGDMGEIGLMLKWGEEFGAPHTWDNDNLSAKQLFCLHFTLKLQQFMAEIADMSAPPENEDANFDDILAAMEEIDRSNMH